MLAKGFEYCNYNKILDVMKFIEDCKRYGVEFLVSILFVLSLFFCQIPAIDFSEI
jgi:hypothetical protein